MKKRILFYVLHLLGIGHVYRAQRLIAALNESGFEVDVIYGGMPLDIKFAAKNIFMLPPIAAGDAKFSFYIDKNGKNLKADYMEKRQKILTDIFTKLKPDMIITETFPFGRRIVSKELLALFAMAKKRTPKPILACSIRDILEPRKQTRYIETKNIIDKYIDYVFVHADENIIGLQETYPLANEIKQKIIYSGFISPKDIVSKNNIKNYDVMVSAGGGAFGFELLQTALQVAKLKKYNHLKWCIITGPNMLAKHIDELKKSLAPHVCLVNYLENFTAHLQRAKFSISQCGYNTSMDILSTNCRAVFVPFDIQGQREQFIRSQLLSQANLTIHLPHSQLNVESLSQALSQAKTLNIKKNKNINFDGGANFSRAITDIFAKNKK